MPVNLQQTLLGPKTVIKDNSLIVDEELVIEGSVTLRSIDMGNNTLIIGLGAEVTVEQDITARQIIVMGRVRANLRATEEIMIGDRAVVEGNLTSPKIKLDPTANVTGVLRH